MTNLSDRSKENQDTYFRKSRHILQKIETHTSYSLMFFSENLTVMRKYRNVKVKQSRYRPGVAQRVPGS
jgi:hypothetical protein